MPNTKVVSVLKNTARLDIRVCFTNLISTAAVYNLKNKVELGFLSRHGFNAFSIDNVALQVLHQFEPTITNFHNFHIDLNLIKPHK